jgi:predicted nucleic acid-binding Zn ribbon protein
MDLLKNLNNFVGPKDGTKLDPDFVSQVVVFKAANYVQTDSKMKGKRSGTQSDLNSKTIEDERKALIQAE